MSRRHRFTSGTPTDYDSMAWAERGECCGVPTSVFFPPPGRNRSKQAKALCGVCDVQSECLSYALRTGQPDGIWGGMTADERQPAPVVSPGPFVHGTESGYSNHRRRGEQPCDACRTATASGGTSCATTAFP